MRLFEAHDRRRVCLISLITRRRYPTSGPPLSSGLSRASSGQQLEPDDNKPLTYAGYSGYRRVCRVL